MHAFALKYRVCKKNIALQKLVQHFLAVPHFYFHFSYHINLLAAAPLVSRCSVFKGLRKSKKIAQSHFLAYIYLLNRLKSSHDLYAAFLKMITQSDQ